MRSKFVSLYKTFNIIFMKDVILNILIIIIIYKYIYIIISIHFIINLIIRKSNF